LKEVYICKGKFILLTKCLDKSGYGYSERPDDVEALHLQMFYFLAAFKEPEEEE